MTDRLRIFNRSGFEIASFQASVSRSWAVGLEGRASFEYASRKTNIVNEEVLRFGNYLLVESDILPAWIGAIDTPRSWSKDAVTVNAYTLERLFQYRRGALEQKLTGSAGTIFGRMVNIINAAEKTVLQIGTTWTGSVSREETLNPNTLERNLKSLQERSGEDYEFVPQIVNGRLVVFANWVQSLGVETPLTLLEGGNIENARMTEDDNIINDLLGYGDGATWTSRPAAITQDVQSIAKYGLRQDGKEWTGVSIISTIQNNNNEYLATRTKPRKIFDITAIDLGDTFSYLRLGNRVNVYLRNMGFLETGRGTQERTRILGMSYNPRQGDKIKLVLRDA